MNAVKKLLNLQFERLEVFKTGVDNIGVCYRGAYVKDGPILSGEYGVGKTFDEACQNYIEQISGKTLVFEAFKENRIEVIVL